MKYQGHLGQNQKEQIDRYFMNENTYLLLNIIAHCTEK